MRFFIKIEIIYATRWADVWPMAVIIKTLSSGFAGASRGVSSRREVSMCFKNQYLFDWSVKVWEHELFPMYYQYCSGLLVTTATAIWPKRNGK